FLSTHNENKEKIISLKKDENVDSVLCLLIVNMSLLSTFMLQHSLMANDFVKHLFCKFHMDYMERSVYNVTSAMALHLLINQWQIISSITLWNVNTSSNSIAWLIFTTLHVLAWSIIYSGCLTL
ncbi:nurim homolog, partial [Osmia bicornis bicornis]|uniref:nurim homolog n=1 Tax=Osmia bicornis bicornis TaxID=1437191 RepID=UPI001EAED09F